MAKTGSITITINSQSIANNTSNVTVRCYITTSGDSWRGDQRTGKCTIDGTTYNFTHGAPKNSKTLVFEKTINISHDSQGKKTLSVSFNYDSGWCTASTSKSLTTIPRNSIFGTVSGSSLGSQITINITRYNSSFTHKVYYKPSNLSTWTTISTSAGTSVSFTPALSLASNAPKSTTLTLNLKIETYSGTTKIGSDATKSISVSIPSSVIPTVSAPVITRIDNGVPSSWEVYVKVYSKLTIDVSGSGIYGSTIDRYEVTVDGETRATTGAAVTFGPFNTAGEKNISVISIDSRGRKSEAKSDTITVQDYAKPTLILEAYRSDAEMNKSNTGTYVTLKATYACSSCGGKNSITSKEFNAGSQKNTTLASGSSIVLSGFSVAEEYYVTGKVIDSMGNSSSDDVPIKINSSNVPIHVRLSKKGVGIGRYCTEDGELQVAYDMVMDEGKTINGIDPSHILVFVEEVTS